MFNKIEINLYKRLASIARSKNIFMRVFMTFAPKERIRKLNIQENIKLNSGEEFKVFTKHWIGFRCFMTGAYDIEKNEEFHMLTILKKSKFSVFMDVGSNHGYYSLKVASLLSDDGIVYAFEPISKNAKILEENINNNGFKSKIKIIKKIVSDDFIEKKIYYAGENNPGASSCAVFDSGSEYEIVDSITLDSFLSEENCKVDFLKIDVEGFELNVLKGMSLTLKTQKPILFVEHNASTLKSNDNSIFDVLEYMGSHGYKAFDIGGENILPYIDGDRSLVLYCHSDNLNKILD